jgi:hypothetical protein
MFCHAYFDLTILLFFTNFLLLLRARKIHINDKGENGQLPYNFVYMTFYQTKLERTRFQTISGSIYTYNAIIAITNWIDHIILIH